MHLLQVVRVLSVFIHEASWIAFSLLILVLERCKSPTSQPAWIDWHRRCVSVGDSQEVLYRSKVATTLRGYLHFLFECIWSMLDLSWTKIWLLPAKEFGKLQRRNGHLPKISSPDLVVAVPFSTGHRHPLGQLRRIETEEVLQPRIWS